MLKETAPSTRASVVGIGASAGGLEALQKFFQGVPADLNLSYVVVVHLAPDRESDLPAILARETKMPVVQVGDHDKAKLEPDHVYVIAPNRKLEITDTSIGASRFEQLRGQRAAIDVFFRSLAAAHGDIFAVVLSGGGSDGALGAKAVKEAGGLVLIQDPHEAAHQSMPQAAIATGVADLVLPVRELAMRLAELVRNKEQLVRLLKPSLTEGTINEDEQAALKRVLDLLRNRTGHDFSKYKPNTIVRRLMRRMQLHHSQSVPEYLRYLERNVEEVQLLFNDLLITVTTFFRDPDAWAALQAHAIAPIVEHADPSATIRCWVPGCATGEEAYTLAMLFSEEIARRQVQRELIVFASDVDEGALATARIGMYPRSITADVSDERLDRWFTAVDDHYRLSSEVRDRVVFATHSLQRDPPFSRLHLISCRNLLIYLNRDLQKQVMGVFRYACRDDAYLFLGTSETASEQYFQPLVKQHRIYRVRPLTTGRRPPLPALPSTIPRPVQRRERERRRPEEPVPAETHRGALEAVAPPSVLVDEQWNVVHLSETAGRFVQPRGGPGTLSLTDWVRPELRDEAGVALRHAFAEGEPWLSPFVPVRFDGTPRGVAVLAQPHGAERSNVLLVFLEAGTATTEFPASDDGGPSSERERALLDKLRQAEDHIARLRSEHHTADEDLRAANEELQSLNEEYRSTTEELETSKEELQSINEELQTVNVELKHKLEEVSRAHNDLENLMAATDVGTLFLDRNLCIKRFTPPLLAVFNVRSHDHGRPIAHITHQLHYDGLERDARRVLSDLVPVEREVLTRDQRALILRMRPYRTSEDKIEGVVITLVEVTKLKQVESALREGEERFRALIDASAQMVWTTDADGHVMEDSPSWRAFTGQTLEQWKGSRWLKAVHAEDRDRAAAWWRQAVESQDPVTNEFRIYHAPSGSYRWTSVRAVPLFDKKGVLRGWVGMNIDITERKEAEQALRESDRRKDEFLAILGHELRNPLAAMRSAIELIENAGFRLDDSSVSRALSVLDRQSRHMTRLINDLLDVTRITSDKLELQRVPTDFGECLEQVVYALQPRIQSAGLKLTLDTPPTPLIVDADPERLAQILDNLLSNAIACTEAGGEITVLARQKARHLVITVCDTGIGFDPGQIESLFSPYQQGNRAASKGDGLGLGLTLVKRLVELHGGAVTARSDGRGRGSEFELALPLAATTPAKRSATAADRSIARRRLLVVDDEPDIANTFAALLDKLGQEVRVAYGGEAAIGVAREYRPQVAFLDLTMPEMSGEELARKLRENLSADELTLVAVTGHAKGAVPHGDHFDHYLLKPVNLADVIEMLSSLPSDA